MQGEAVGFDLEQGDVGEGVEAEDLGGDDVAVGEFYEDRLGRLAGAAGIIGDDVGVGDYFAAGVEHETRALGGAAFEDRADRDHAGRGLAEDLGRVKAAVGGLDGDLGRGLRRRRWSRRSRAAAAGAAAGEQRQAEQQRRERRPGLHAGALARVSSGWASAPTCAGGRSSVKAVKRRLELIVMRPSIRCASSLAIARPSPEPPALSAV